MLKDYLIDNLNKGFIEYSSALFVLPILFVKKPSGGLRFYIDYRKLNKLTERIATRYYFSIKLSPI